MWNKASLHLEELIAEWLSSAALAVDIDRIFDPDLDFVTLGINGTNLVEEGTPKEVL